MKKLSVLFVALTAIVFLSTSCDARLGGGKMKNDVDSASYAIGILQGSQLQKGLEGIPGGYNRDVLLAAYYMAMKEDTSSIKMTIEEAQNYLQNYIPKAEMKEATANKAASEKFLEENKKKEGVQVTASGLQYKVIQEGSGARPDSTSTVKVHYKGTTIDGEEFDSSYKRNEPTSFQVTHVIKGWTEGLLMMPVGSKYMLYIPSDLAYGERGTGGKIKGNMALVFEVELVDIEAPKTPDNQAQK